MDDDAPSAAMEHLAWVRIQCLQIACKARPHASAATQVSLAMAYENYVMDGPLPEEAMH